jgi:hypothetical protein
LVSAYSELRAHTEGMRTLPVILINVALSEGVFFFVRICETSGSNTSDLLQWHQLGKFVVVSTWLARTDLKRVFEIFDNIAIKLLYYIYTLTL